VEENCSTESNRRPIRSRISRTLPRSELWSFCDTPSGQSFCPRAQSSCLRRLDKTELAVWSVPLFISSSPQTLFISSSPQTLWGLTNMMAQDGANYVRRSAPSFLQSLDPFCSPIYIFQSRDPFGTNKMVDAC
jgi:hypothetical protein